MPPPTAPLADEFLLNRRRRILEIDFSALNAALAGIQQNQIATEINNLVVETRQARADATAWQLAAQNKTPAELLGPVGTLKLLRYAQQPTVATLSNIWALFANNKKSQHLADLQIEVNGAKEELNE